MSIEIKICEDLPLGTWRGMGGAITEATAYNFSKLNSAKQKKLLEAYYGKDGLDYRWCRLSIGSNDFCLKSYDYDLKNFSIDHDKQWVIPMLKQIKKDLTFIAAPWSPPKKMKIIPKLCFGGRLKPWCYDDYADFIKLWLEAYEKEGIKIDYLSPQNEPRARQIWESCKYSYRAQRKLAEAFKDLGPKLLLWDHNKKHLLKVANKLLPNSPAAGLCFHWYDGTHPDQMWAVRQKYPDKMLVSSEMCCGFSPYDTSDWQNDARLYLGELINDINCGTVAWLDWNMLLDWNGGPSYCRNFVKSPVILNEAGDDFILTPIYDALKSFAKLFPAGSEIVRCDFDSNQIAAVARRTKTGYDVIVANLTAEPLEISLGGKTVALAPSELKSIKNPR